METINQVVARYLDGRVVKGVTQDFSPNRANFHIHVHGSGEVVEVRFRQLKALFFVHDFVGNSARQDVRGFVEGPAETQQGKKIAVRFKDGEFICGYTLTWSPEREGFFMFPADPTSNNLRIFALTAATLEVKAGPASEVLARRVLAEAPVEKSGPESSVGKFKRQPGAAGPLPSRVLPRPPLENRPEPRTGTD